jgi:hypothetical protein
LFVTSLSFVVCHKFVSCYLSQVCLVLFIISLSFVVYCKYVVIVVCRKYIYCCCLSLFHVNLNYEIFRSCNEGAKTRALMKLTISSPPPSFWFSLWVLSVWCDMISFTILMGCEGLIMGTKYFITEKPWIGINLCICRKLILPNHYNAPRRLRSQPCNIKLGEQMLHPTWSQVSRCMISKKTRLCKPLFWECNMLLDVWDSFEMMLLRLKGLHGRYKFKSQVLFMDALTRASYSEHNNEALNVLGVKIL